MSSNTVKMLLFEMINKLNKILLCEIMHTTPKIDITRLQDGLAGIMTSILK